MKKKSVAPTRISLIIGDSQHLCESSDFAKNSHAKLCDQLLQNPLLLGWELLFVRTLAKSSKPGRKQLEKLEAISSRLGYSLTEKGGKQ